MHHVLPLQQVGGRGPGRTLSTFKDLARVIKAAYPELLSSP